MLQKVTKKKCLNTIWRLKGEGMIVECYIQYEVPAIKYLLPNFFNLVNDAISKVKKSGMHNDIIITPDIPYDIRKDNMVGERVEFTMQHPKTSSERAIKKHTKSAMMCLRMTLWNAVGADQEKIDHQKISFSSWVSTI